MDFKKLILSIFILATCVASLSILAVFFNKGLIDSSEELAKVKINDYNYISPRLQEIDNLGSLRKSADYYARMFWEKNKSDLQYRRALQEFFMLIFALSIILVILSVTCLYQLRQKASNKSLKHETPQSGAS